jgi:transposase
MRFVPIKSREQQGVTSLHRVREGLKEERTGCINQIRGVLGEFGLVFPKSAKALRAVLSDVIEDAGNELSTMARLVVQRAFEHWRELDEHMRWCDQQVGQRGRQARGEAYRHRRTRCLGIHRQRGRLQAVQERRPVRLLAGHRAAPELQRRQGQPGRIYPSAATTTCARC